MKAASPSYRRIAVRMVGTSEPSGSCGNGQEGGGHRVKFQWEGGKFPTLCQQRCLGRICAEMGEAVFSTVF